MKEDRFYAGGFLYNPKTRSVLLHLRDGNTKFNPNKWAFFGGLQEGDEKPTETFIREVQEELGISLQKDEVIPLRDYLNTVLQTYRYVFYAESDLEISQMTLGEGAGFDWVPIDRIREYDLTELTEKDLVYFIETVLK